MSEDFNEQIGRLDERMGSMEEKIDDLSTKVDQIRAPKMWPTVLGVVAVVGFIGGIGAGWVNLRLEPIKIQQAQGQKDFDRLYDDVRALQKAFSECATVKYVDDKTGYMYHELKNKIPTYKSP